MIEKGQYQVRQMKMPNLTNMRPGQITLAELSKMEVWEVIFIEGYSKHPDDIKVIERNLIKSEADKMSEQMNSVLSNS